jgi:uncharacterized MnhB-related membrane protein
MIDTTPYWANHDAGTLPWLAVLGYLTGTYLCYRRYRSTALPRERIFWALAAATMLAMGVNKQLDIQTTLTDIGRTWAREGGWYEQRRAVQEVFVLMVTISMAAVSAALVWLVRGLQAAVLTALAGLCLLGLFILIRAASFHHIDIAMRIGILGLKLHTVLELMGIATVIAGARMQARQRIRKPVRKR